MKAGFFTLLLALSTGQASANYLDDHLQKIIWDGLEVQWIEESSHPIYDVIIKFQAGAITDSKHRSGETEMMFSQLTSGTTQYSQKDISEHLEFYGTQYDVDVTHEYSLLKVRGLVKDILPTMKMVCHLFNRATFPKNELKKAQKRYFSHMKNLPTQLSALAERSFRQISLSQTPFDQPTEGSIKSVSKITSKDLQNKLKFFNDKVKKKVFIVGPKGIKDIKNVFKNDCGWTEKADGDYFGPEVTKKYKKSENTVHLIAVPGANQAQIRLGSHLTIDQIGKKPDHLKFAYTFLGGGFTSQLMTELRVKRGLTYSAGAIAAGQKNYGRAVISTFSKNEDVAEALKVIKEVLDMKNQNYSEETLVRTKKFAKGNYLFGLESPAQFMNNLIYFDHIGRKYSEIYEYPQTVTAITQAELKAKLSEIFDWNHMTIVLVGDPSLKKSLTKEGYKVKLHKVSEFL